MTIKLTSIIKNITEVIPGFKKLPVAHRSWLINMYARSYNTGVKAIGRDIFTNPGYVTTQELMERLKRYPEVSVHETEFMHLLADGDEESLNMVLDENKEQDDFVYSIYEENYSDWVPKAVARALKNIPVDLKKYDLDLLAQEAFSQGIIWAVDRYAKRAIIKYAKKAVTEED